MPTEESPRDEQPEPDGGFTTDSADARFSYTNDILAGLLIAFAVALTAFYVYSGQDVPLWLATVDSLGVASALIWAFGKGAIKQASELIRQPPR